MEKKKIICWWSGGITSAVACKLAIDMFGIDNCEIIMQDTGNEHPDTYRFKNDCEAWYGKKIQTITAIGTKYNNIKDVWYQFLSLNTATGAICSTELKRLVREEWQKSNSFDYQVFGFEFEQKEFKRAKSLKLNHPKAKSICPLLMMGYDKNDCLRIVEDAGIEIPITYKLGYKNNNCWKTGCTQGGIGYWQKIEREEPPKFDAMADVEHELTDLKGTPVTMLKDQSNAAKALVEKTGDKWRAFVFLKKHPNYPEIKCLADMKPQEVKPLLECNGFCGTNDLNPRNETEQEINFDTSDIISPNHNPNP